jgi:hypothetical protein
MGVFEKLEEAITTTSNKKYQLRAGDAAQW